MLELPRGVKFVEGGFKEGYNPRKGIVGKNEPFRKGSLISAEWSEIDEVNPKNASNITRAKLGGSSNRLYIVEFEEANNFRKQMKTALGVVRFLSIRNKRPSPDRLQPTKTTYAKGQTKIGSLVGASDVVRFKLKDVDEKFKTSRGKSDSRSRSKSDDSSSDGLSPAEQTALM